jgi:prophage regulatory protein
MEHRKDTPVANAPRLMALNDVAEMLTLSRSTLYRLMWDDPSFPRPVHVTKRRVAFVASEVDAYIAARVAERSPQGGV